MTVLRRNSVYKMNCENAANGLDLLKDINDQSVATVFLDPQYRMCGMKRLSKYTHTVNRLNCREDLLRQRQNPVMWYLIRRAGDILCLRRAKLPEGIL